MRWYRTLKPGQRRILLGLLVSLVAVLGLLGWSVWRTIGAPQAPQASPPLPTPGPTRTPSPTPSPTPTLTPAPTLTATPPPFDIAQAGIIAARVSDARGRSARWSTPLTLINSQLDMSVALYHLYATHPPSLLRLQPQLAALRLWHWEEVRVDPVAQAQAMAALYNSETEELYLRRDWSDARDVLEWQIAYGYARAVPDQYGDLPRLIANADSLDHKLALTAVGDGDALFSLWRYAGVEPGSDQAQAMTDAIAAAVTPRWRPSDPLLNDLSQLAFTLGATFFTDLYALGGAEAVDAAILRPPRSTAQLLHVERYLADEIPLRLAPLQPQLGRGWALRYTDTLGEALIRLTMQEWSEGALATDDIAEHIAHWRGDLLHVWDGPADAAAGTQAEAIAWQTVWDSGRSAASYYGALVQTVPHPLLPGRIDDTTPPAELRGGRWWAGPQGALYLYRQTNRVWLVWGTDVAAVETLGIALRATR